jgi:GTPase-associated protein 1, N-terminal domain type 1/Effector-associated domain 1
MKVEQAIYGEVNRGHALRLTSTPSNIANELASRLDLPDTAPLGVDWSPFISSFPYGDRYVLARTFADPAATRGGMVLSHAIIAPLEDMLTTTDLRPLFDLLIKNPEVPRSLLPVEVPVSNETPISPADLAPTAEALVTRTDNPIVRLGSQGFEELMTALWFHLWPEFRANFAFRLSFGPNDIVDSPTPLIVCTPSSLASRWIGSRIIGSETKELSDAAAILCGGMNVEILRNFAREIGAQLKHPSDLKLLALSQKYDPILNSNFKDCLVVVRLIEKLSPNPDAGRIYKENLINSLCSQIDSLEITSVLQFRNLRLTGFHIANKVWMNIENWVVKSDLREVDDTDFVSALDDAFSGAAIESWSEAILNGLVICARKTSWEFPTAFWRWAKIKPATIESIFKHLPVEPELEVRLSNAAKQKVSSNVGETVMALALTNKWLLLHGAAAGVSLTPWDAYQRQALVDKNFSSINGVRAALKLATDEQIIEIALKRNDAQIISIAAEQVSKKPHLLKDISITSESAQAIWNQAIDININAWQGPTDPRGSFNAILENLLEVGVANVALIEALSVTPIADLSGFSRCAELWPLLSESSRTNLLKATAIGWLDSASSGYIVNPDAFLGKAIASNSIVQSKLRNLVSNNFRVALQIISVLPAYTESQFLECLGTWPVADKTVTPSDVESLGHFLHSQNWQQAVNRLLQFAERGIQEVKPALRICRDMISLWEIWKLGITEISISEKWKIFETLVCELYSRGPDDGELWERAGGQNHQLQSYGTGQERWRNAISQIRQGKFPRLSQLLREIKIDFPSNIQVGYLVNDPDLRKH